MFFVAAALVAAWYGGARSGTGALLLGMFLADHFFRSTNELPTLSQSVAILHLVRYVFTASLGIALIEVLRRSRDRAEEAREQLRIHAGELERRVAERTASLAATVKSLEGILYHIAHNLRAPLRAMSGYSDVLLRETKPRLNGAGEDCLRRICEASGRMDILIKALLDYGRLTHIALNIRDVDFHEAIQESLYQSAYQIKSGGARINVLGLSSRVRADHKLLVEIIVQLLDNAIKFCNPGSAPRIDIWAEPRGELVRLSVRDYGIGIPELYHQRIFRPFEQLYPSAAHEGTGIGLAIMKEGIDRMGGLVGLESKPGVGSTFWIELPKATEAHSLALSSDRSGGFVHAHALVG